MCGLCLEPEFLQGWQRGFFDTESVSELSASIGEDVGAAHVLSEQIHADGARAADILQRYKPYSLTPWVILQLGNRQTISTSLTETAKQMLQRYQYNRQQPEHQWARYSAETPHLHNYICSVSALPQENTFPGDNVLDEAEHFLIRLHGGCFYYYSPPPPDSAFKFKSIEARTDFYLMAFCECPLEIFLITQMLLLYRPDSWVLPVCLTMQLPADFDSYYPAWRRYVASMLFANQPRVFSMLAETLPLTVLYAAGHQYAADADKLASILAIVARRSGDEQMSQETVYSRLMQLVA